MNTSPEIDPLALPIGTQLGPYRVVSPLGKGGMGTVYVVERDGRQFAAKLTKRKFSELSEDDRERIDARVRREISILWAVSHPNVVRIHSADRWPDMRGYLYLITDLVDGEPLTSWQAKAKPSLRKLVDTFIGIANGVHELHRAHFIHRDLKSENVIVDSTGRPVIIDFGISRHRDSYTLTSQATLVGTSDHLSPEFCLFFLEARAAKGEKYEHRPTDDLHAIGFMLYEALCGQPPFELHGDNEWTLFQDIAKRVPSFPRSLHAGVPASLDAIAMHLLEKDPVKRFQTALELEEALRAALAEGDASWDAPFTPPPYRPFRERGTAAPPISGLSAGSFTGLVASNAESAVQESEVRVPSSENRPAPPVASGLSSTSVRAPVAYEAGAAPVPMVNEPPASLSLESAPRFVSLDAPAKKLELAPAEAKLPSVVREAVDAVKRPGTPLKSRAWVVLLLGVAVVLVLALLGLRSNKPQAPKDLLKSFEQQRAEELAATRDPTAPIEASPTAIPPAEQVRETRAPSIITPAPPSEAPTRAQPERTIASVRRPSSSRRTHHGKLAKEEAAKAEPLAQSPALQPDPPRSLLRTSAMREVVASSGLTGTSLGIQRGRMFQARLTVPVSPQALGPVTAVVSADVVVNGKVAVPRDSSLVGSAVSAEGSRVRIRWDTLNVQGRGAVPIEALAYGADQLPGIPYRAPEGDSAPSPTKDAALSTGEHILNRFLGDDVAGDLGRGAAGAAAESARAPSRPDSRPVVISKGPGFYVFVTKAF